MYRIDVATPADLGVLRSIDDDACGLYASAGLHLDFPADHPFAIAESELWQHSLNLGRVFLARDVTALDSEPVAFAALALPDGRPYLEQLSVRRAHGRRGVGGMLLEHACRWAVKQSVQQLWLATYAHIPWNAPFYERRGFVRVAESQCGAELRAYIAEHKRVLPQPGQRIVMFKGLYQPTNSG
jgi:GNAT superfamily N-acetyltransferase